jgi:hypothetical protein
MKILKSIVITLAFLFFATAGAEAVELFTAPLIAAGTDLLSCQIVNVTVFARPVYEIQVIDLSGTVVQETPFQIILPAGEAASISANVSGYCRFRVSSKTYFRAGAGIIGTTGSNVVFAPAE